MSVEFSLYTKDKNNEEKRVGPERLASICFALLGSDAQMASYTQQSQLAAKKIHAIRYYPKPEVTEKNALKWYEAVLNEFGLNEVVPGQSALSIKENGFFISGEKVAGPMITGALSLIRCVDEEPQIVDAFVELMKFKGMDAVTAIVLAHQLQVVSTDLIRTRKPNNTNHTVYTGWITKKTLTEAWDKVWLKKNKEFTPWAEDRSSRGTFAFFSPEGNRYVPQELIFKKAKYSRRSFYRILNGFIYPLRAAHFAGK